MTASSDAMIGRKAGNYFIERQLGEGGMGAVYAAKHVTLNQWRAVKVLLPRVAQNPDAVARFQGEARAASEIQNPYIVRIDDVGRLEDGDREHYIVMEMFRGYSLHELRKPVPELGTALWLVLQVCAGLQPAHERGIVHRDLKPGNLFLADDIDGQQRVKILDFGLAKLTTASLAAGLKTTNAILGTPIYMAPEQAKLGTPVTHLADIYALGAITYELLTGRLPFTGTVYEVLYQKMEGTPVDVRQLRPDLPEAWAAVIHRALSVVPRERPQSARDFAELLVEGLPGGQGRPIAAALRFEVRGHAQLPGLDGNTQAIPGAAPSTLSAASGQSAPSSSALSSRRWVAPIAAAGLMAVLGASITALIAGGGSAEGDRAERAAAVATTLPPDARARPVARPADARPAPARVKLRVETTPAQARVLVDDVFVGSAPVVLDKPEGTTLTVRVEAEGYAPSSQTTTLTTDDTLHVELVAKPKKKRKRKARDPEREGFDTWSVPKRKKPLWR